MPLRLPPPRAIVAVAGMLAVALVCGELGRWQLRRADESSATAERFTQTEADAALGAAPSDAVRDAVRFRRIEVDGAYEPERQFLLDNIVHDSVPGYDVLTPFRLADGGPRVVVNRGWVPASPDRSVLPSIDVGVEPRTLRARIDKLPEPGMRLGVNAVEPGATAAVTVVQYPTAAELVARLEQPLHDYQLLLDAAEPDGYVREWQAPGLPSDRHLMYAGQWLLFAAGALGVAVTIVVKQLRRRA